MPGLEPIELEVPRVDPRVPQAAPEVGVPLQTMVPWVDDEVDPGPVISLMNPIEPMPTAPTPLPVLYKLRQRAAQVEDDPFEALLRSKKVSAYAPHGDTTIKVDQWWMDAPPRHSPPLAPPRSTVEMRSPARTPPSWRCRPMPPPPGGLSIELEIDVEEMPSVATIMRRRRSPLALASLALLVPVTIVAALMLRPGSTHAAVMEPLPPPAAIVELSAPAVIHVAEAPVAVAPVAAEVKKQGGKKARAAKKWAAESWPEPVAVEPAAAEPVVAEPAPAAPADELKRPEF